MQRSPRIVLSILVVALAFIAGQANLSSIASARPEGKGPSANTKGPKPSRETTTTVPETTTTTAAETTTTVAETTTTTAAETPTTVARVETPTAPNADGRFHVVGRKIIGPDGLEFIPRGVNKSGLEWRSDGYELEWWNFTRMRSWGANFVRIHLSPHFALPSMCTYDPNYLSRIDQVVAWGEALEMMVLLDDHWSTQGRTCGAAGWADQQKMADAHNVQFLKVLANRYKDHPLVAFDLYNEPHDISDEVWRNGGTVDGWEAVGMQQMLDAVRSTGATNIVFASGNNWANDLNMVASQPLARDANVVYAAHSYPLWCNGTVSLSIAYTCLGSKLPPFVSTAIAPAIEAGLPVAITEFGTPRAISDEIKVVIDWAESKGIGWAAHAWCYGQASDYCLLDSSYQNVPSLIGAPVQAALMASRGWTTLGGK